MSKKAAKQKETTNKSTVNNSVSNKANPGVLSKLFQTYQREIIICGIIVFLNLFVFGQSLSYPFINYDDDTYVFNNPMMSTGLNGESLRWAFTTFLMGHWHPLTWISLLIDAQLFGIKPGGFHFTNLLLHIINSVLLFLLLRYLTNTNWRSAIVAALFAIHPLHVESVVWISSRKDLLSTLFGLMTIFAYACYVKNSQSNAIENNADTNSIKRSVWLYYLLTLIFFALALMSKAMVITLPFVLLLLDYWPLNRITARKTDQSLISIVARLVLEKVPLFVLIAICIKLAIAASFKGIAVVAATKPTSNSGMVLDRFEWFAAGVRAYIDYLLRTFFPFDLSIYYPYETYYTAVGLLGSLLVVGSISIYVILQMRQHPYLFIGWCWFVGMIIPVARLVQADRYTYISHIGLFIMLVWGIAVLLKHWQTSAQTTGIGVSVIVIILMAMSWSQVQLWHDTFTLFKHSVDVTKNNLFMHFNLGVEYERMGKLNESMNQYNEALRLNPDYGMAHLNLGNILVLLNRPAEAEQHYQQALKLMPDHVETSYNYGKFLAQQNKLDQAIQHLSTAIKYKPNFPEAYNNLGGALFTQGKNDEALKAINESLRLNPNNPEARYNLACIYFTKENYPMATEQYIETLRLRPTFAEAHYFLGLIYYKQGNNNEALKRFQEALRIKPNFPQAQASLTELQQKLNQNNQAMVK